MKRFTVVLTCVFIVALAMPAFAAHLDDDEQWRFNVNQVRYRFDHEIASVGTTDDSSEYMDDDFDTTWTFNKGDIEVFFELEIADSNLGDDVDPQPDWASVLGAYSAKWTPESMAEREFRLEVGDFGTGFGKYINNDDSPHGSIEVGWKMGEMSMVLGYGRVYEGDTNDDAEGDEHLIRGQVSMPLGESGFSLGAYVAAYLGADLVFEEAADELPAVMGDRNVFLGAVEFSGTVSSLDIYSEVGFATGKEGPSDAEIDLSGFYAMGGASFALGQVTLGVEGGFASGDDDPTDDEDTGFTAVNSDFWLGQILHDEELIVRTNGSGGGLSNLIYAQATADVSPSEKLDVSAGAIYLAPVEEVGGADSYGFEFFGSTSYQLAEMLKYNFYFGYAVPNEDFLEDNKYQFTNRLEFAF
jgi:hypothetical protein